MKINLSVLMALGLLIAVATMPVYADDVPPLPHAFYGDLTINGSPAPAGTTVEARGTGVITGIEGNPIATTETGKYGSADPLGTKLIVQGNILDSTSITFYVNNVSTGQTTSWHSGEVTQINLSVTIVAPEVTTNAATGISTTTATLNGNLTNIGSTSPVSVSFQWGTSTIYGNETSVKSLTSVGSFSASLSGLSPGTTYHFRAKAMGAIVSYGADRTFTTSSAPSGGGGGGGAEVTPTLTISTNLFGTGGVFDIDSNGRVLTTIRATSVDGMLTIEIPEGTIALDKNGESLDVLEIDIDTSPPDPPEGSNIIGLSYDFQPKGATFDPPITISWSYDPDVLPEGVIEEELVIAYYDEEAGEWIELVCTVDTVNNTITATIDHFTVFAIIGKGQPAAFTINSLSVSPDEVMIGETVDIALSVSNTGGKSGTYTAVLYINDSKEEEKTATITAGSTQDIVFMVTKNKAGSYSVLVEGLSGSFSVSAPKLEPEPKPGPEPEPEPKPEPTPEPPTPAPTPPEPTPPQPEVEEGPNWPLVGGIIGGGIIVIIVIILLVRRKSY